MYGVRTWQRNVGGWWRGLNWFDLRMMNDDKEGELVLILLSWRCEFITRVWSHNILYCDFWTCWTVNYDFHQFWIVIFLNRNSVVLLHPQAMREQLLNFPGTPASSGNRDTNFLKTIRNMSKKSVKHKGTPSFSSDYRNSWPRKLTRSQEKSSVTCSVLLIPFRCGQVQGGRRKIPQSFPRERVCKFPHKNGNFRGTPFRSPNLCNMKTAKTGVHQTLPEAQRTHGLTP